MAIVKTIVFPNPSTCQFTFETGLDLDLAKIVVTDLNGKRIDITIIPLNNALSIDLAEAAPGIYLLTIYKEQQIFQFKLVKE